MKCQIQYLRPPSAFIPDRTPQRLEFTQNVAEATLNRSGEVLQTITPISSKVEEWATNMRNNEYSTTAYEEAVLSAGQAGTMSTATLHFLDISLTWIDLG